MLKTKINDQQDKIDNLNKDIQKYFKTFSPTETAILQTEKTNAANAEQEKIT